MTTTYFVSSIVPQLFLFDITREWFWGTVFVIMCIVVVWRRIFPKKYENQVLRDRRIQWLDEDIPQKPQRMSWNDPVWKQYAAQKGLYYDPHFPQVGKIEGKVKTHYVVITGIKKPGDTMQMMNIRIYNPLYLPFQASLPESTEYNLQRKIFLQLWHSGLCAGLEAAPKMRDDGPFDIPPPFARPQETTHRASQYLSNQIWGTELFFKWQVIPQTTSELDKEFEKALALAESYNVSADDRVVEYISKIFAQTSNTWVQFQTLLFLVVYFPRHSGCQSLIQDWKERWMALWPEETISPFDANNAPPHLFFLKYSHANELPDDIAPLPSASEKRFWVQMGIVYLESLYPRLSNETIDANAFLPWTKWGVSLFHSAVTESLLDREQLQLHFAKFAVYIAPEEAASYLRQNEFAGPYVTNPQLHQTYQWMRQHLWERIDKGNHKSLLRSLLSEHMQSSTPPCQQEAFALVEQKLAEGTAPNWFSFVVALPSSSVWFEYLSFLQKQHHPHYVTFLHCLLDRVDRLSDEQIEQLFWSLELQHDHQTLSRLREYLTLGSLSPHLRDVVQQVYKSIQQQLGSASAGGLALVQADTDQGQLSIAEDAQGQLSLKPSEPESPPPEEGEMT